MMMPKKKKPTKLEKYLMPKNGVFSHEFFVLVTSMVIVILAIGQIFSAAGPPLHDDYKAKKVHPKKVVKKPASGMPKTVPINVWNGIASPIEIPPGLPPVIKHLPTTQPVVFVTIDDGWVQTPENLNWLTARRLPLTMFLTNDGIGSNYQYFYALQSAGMTVQNHTLTHSHLPSMTPEQQRSEVCGASDTYQDVFKHRPTLFRPPYGEYNDDTRRLVAECGMRAVVLWNVVLEKDTLQFSGPEARLMPGDIILAHFQDNLASSLDALARELAAQGLQVARLEDWIE